MPMRDFILWKVLWQEKPQRQQQRARQTRADRNINFIYALVTVLVPATPSNVNLFMILLSLLLLFHFLRSSLG